MKKRCFVWCLAVLLLVTFTAYGVDYYVDPATGGDSNSGLSNREAWGSLEKVNSTVFLPGDRILLKRGSIFDGQLYPKGSGAEGKPIIIDAYGQGNKPLINGGSVPLDENKRSSTVYLFNQEYWEINNLEITNDDNFLVNDRDAARTGIFFEIANFGIARHIYIRNCYVHDVDGNEDGDKTSGGIAGEATRFDQVPSHFDDILIEYNTIEKVDRTGIKPARVGHYIVNTNVVVRNNTLRDIGGDGIIIRSCIAPVCEYNVVTGFRQRSNEPNAGIWPWACKDALFQFNEVSGGRGTFDGMGFDSDYNSEGTIHQYEYSHDNDGGFMLICGGATPGMGNDNTIVRYCISENDKARVFQLHGERTVGTKIYNNTVYLRSGIGTPKVFEYLNWGGTVGPTEVYNNIFYVLNGAHFEYNANVTFNNNLYFGVSGELPIDPDAVLDDPLFFDPGKGYAGGYKLRPESPAIDRGIFVASNGGRDYFGNPLNDGAADLGAHEYSFDTPGDEEKRPPVVKPFPTLKVPGRVEAEECEDSSGVNISLSNPGDIFHLGGLDGGDWMDYYVNVTKPGVYTINVVYGTTPNLSGARPGLMFFNGDRQLGHVTLSKSSADWFDWKSDSVPVNLEAGPQTIRVLALYKECYIDYFDISYGGETPAGPVEPLKDGENGLVNSDFEGADLANWFSWNEVSINNEEQYAGAGCVSIGPGECSVNQLVVNLEPNTYYKIEAMAKTSNPTDFAYIGVQQHGRARKDAKMSGIFYRPLSVIFKTGPTSRSAVIYGYKSMAGDKLNTSGSAYFDNFSLTRYNGNIPEEDPLYEENYLKNPGFERGNYDGWGPWNAWFIKKNIQHRGRYALELHPGAPGSFEQTVKGLTPGQTYRLTAWAKVSDNANDLSFVDIGVGSYGGQTVYQRVSSLTYTQVEIIFTVGPNSTQATIYTWAPGSELDWSVWPPVVSKPNTSSAYVDDFYLNKVDVPEPPYSEPVFTLPDTSGPGLLIEDFNDIQRWNSGENLLGQPLVRKGGNWNLENSQCAYMYYNPKASLDNYINRDISAYDHLFYTIKGQDGGEEVDLYVVLNDGRDHYLRMSDYGKMTNAYGQIAIPLVDFEADLTGVVYIRTFGTGVGAVRFDGMRLTSGNNSGSTKFTLNVGQTGGGRGEISISPRKSRYNPGELVVVRTVPDLGSVFGGWRGDSTASTATIYVKMDSDKDLTALFNPVPLYYLNTSAGGPGQGTVSVDPNRSVYQEGSLVSLIASPLNGSYFDSWLGENRTVSFTQVVMDADKDITALFKKEESVPEFTLEVSPAGNGSGSILFDPPGGVYTKGTVVTVTAAPAEGSVFDGFSGDVNGTAPSVMVSMESDKQISAEFSLKNSEEYEYTIREGAGGVLEVTFLSNTGADFVDTQVRKNGGGITGYRMNHNGSSVHTIQLPGFSGGLTYEVRFVYQHDQAGQKLTSWDQRFYGGTLPITLEVEKSGSGRGNITISPDKSSYEKGEVVTITAEAGEGSEFGGFSGDAESTNPVIKVVMESSKHISASFKSLQNPDMERISAGEVKFTFTKSGTNWVDVQVKNGGIVGFRMDRQPGTGTGIFELVVTHPVVTGTIEYRFLYQDDVYGQIIEEWRSE